MLDKLIDVADTEGHIDWHQVKEWGCQGAMLRATIGADGWDVQYQANVEGCFTEGIPFGSYFDLFPWKPVAEQVEWFNAWRVPNQLPDGIDWELSSGESSQHATIAVITAALVLVRLSAKRPMLYANIDYLTNRLKLKSTLAAGCDLWLAWPSTASAYPGMLWPAPAVMWQYKWHQVVPGIAGDCQVDRWYGKVF